MAEPDRPVLLAVFGAGASHGCLPFEPSATAHVLPPSSSHVGATQYAQARPPLTQELLRPGDYAAAILGRYQAALPVADAVQRRMEAGEDSRTISLERALGEYQELTAVDRQTNRHLAAFRFYLRDLLWACSELMRSPSIGGGRTNHVALVRNLHTWASSRNAHVCLTSFNYDFILESACTAVWGFDPHDLNHHCSYGPVSLLKPHGSVLWEQLIHNHEAVHANSRAQQAIELMTQNPELTPIVPLPTSPFSDYTRPPGVPALALPVDGKSVLVWPDEQEQQFGRLQGRVSKLLIVGWRAVDQHFVGLMDRLASGAKAVIVTGGPEADREAEAIRERLWGVVLDNTTKVVLVTTEFTGFLHSDRLAWLLAD
ncbi:MAG TPA: hypothetical protein VHF47_06475 [Acidimicrobiales bacterium]|nr:hypothetical protein [Acidimicrobiales bacterium]